MTSLLDSNKDVAEFAEGQQVQTSFGRGVVSAISFIDRILYVTLSAEPEPLYILRPEQVRPIDDASVRLQ